MVNAEFAYLFTPGRPPVNYVDSDDGDSDDYLGSLEVNNVSDKDHVIWVSPEVQGRVVKMELDTVQLCLYSHTNSIRNILVM